MKYRVFFIMAFICCCSSPKNENWGTKEMKTIFTKEELNDIYNLVELFNKKVCDDPDDLGCYKLFYQINNDHPVISTFELLDQDVFVAIDQFIQKHPKTIWQMGTSHYYDIDKGIWLAQITPETKIMLLYEFIPKDFEILASSEKEIIEAGILSGEGYLFYDAIYSEFDKNTLRRHDINLLIAVDALGAFYNIQLELEHGYDRYKPIKINFGAPY
jgi:hypothetical protein